MQKNNEPLAMTYHFELLHYKGLDSSGLEKKLNKIYSYLQMGDFKTAEVKKLSTNGYYRAKLDDTNRLLFKPMNFEGKTYLLVLEIIRNHDYDKSRFLRGAVINETHISTHRCITITHAKEHPSDRESGGYFSKPIFLPSHQEASPQTPKPSDYLAK